MNIKLTKQEAIGALTPILSDKLNADVTVDISDVNPLYVPPDVQSRLSALRIAFTKTGQYYNKIAMIKEIRTMTGWGLKDSKDFVETILYALRVD